MGPMNPRRRRLLFPALLVVLLVVAAVVSWERKADATSAEEEQANARVVSTVRDGRIAESSGLAVSQVHDDLAYTINDSGNADVVFAIRVSTGEVVGTTTVQGTPWLDTEALALHDGKLWIGDVGDNLGRRDDAALYAIDEPGPENGTARSTRYPVAYEDGPQDVESLAVDAEGRFLLVTKDLLAGQVLRLPARLSTEQPNVPEPVGDPTLLMATDASTSPDGRFVVVRNYISAAVLDAADLSTLRTEALPQQRQGETVAFEPSGGSYLIGTEGSPWALQRVGFLARTAGAAAPSATPTPSATTPSPAAGSTPGEIGRPWFAVVVGGVGVLLLAGLGAWTARSRDDD
jgi:hypothetical protein